jgi:HEAT repeat protein
VPADLATPPPATLTADDKRAFTDAWRHFLDRSPLWPSRRRAWLARGGAADQVLAENLFRYFWAMSFQARADEVDRVAREASHVGAVAVPYFGRPLVVDSIPLKEPLRVKVEDPDDPKKSHFKMVSELQMDDITRRDAATVLGEIGEPAVPLLARDDVLVTGRPATRRHAARALGRIGSDAAVDALVAVLVRGTDWQDRAAIVAGLGAALPHPRARAALEQARQDSDPFVRRKAEEALAR